MNDLPLPPPPSPTQLQQFEIYNNNNINNSINNNESQHTRTLSSLSSMSTGSNTTHSSTQSLSPTPYNYHLSNTIMQQQQQQLQQQQQQQHSYQMTHFQPYNEATNSSLSLDQSGSSSPLHSRQASSSSSSLNYGCCNNDNYGTITAIPPPPPPPLPQDNNQDLYINTMKHQHNTNNRKLLMTKQNENDMNTYNKTNVSTLSQSATAAVVPALAAGTNTQDNGGGVGVGVRAGCVVGSATPVLPATQKVYNKFLKEYSNKLLTQGNNNSSMHSPLNAFKDSDNGNNVHSFINNGTPKPFIATPSPNTKQTQHQHNHYLQQQQQQTNNTNNSNNIINSSLPGVAAITATLNNQLKFDSCQVAPSLPTTATTIATAITPSSSNISIVDKTPFNNNSNSQIINDYNYKTNSTATTTNEMSSTVATTGPTDKKPFEYVTLTGNVIRSVVPPGKGNVNYKVNQGGYARPYGAAPPAAAPKSPVTYPPQSQQQWNQPPPTQPKPAVGGNAYATLPRSNVGQQESLIKPSMLSDTLPRKTNNNKPKTNASFANANDASLQQATDLPHDDPTAMLNESIGKINMGQKMDNFMAEAGKVISNMLEARLANNGNGMPSPHSSSSLSLRSNSSSNLSRSPMVVRKRLDLDDFKDLNPTEPAALKPVITVPQNMDTKLQDFKPQPIKTVNSTVDLPPNHPMGKILELCDNKAKPPLVPSAKPEMITGGLPPSETVIYRNNDRSNRRASHATDRRSYIENGTQTEQPKDGPVFSISVKALGKPGEDPNKPMSPENEDVVSQLLKDGKKPICCQCNCEITSGPFITALGKIWCPDHFHCVNGNCRRPLQDIGFVEEKGDLYCEYCFEKYLAPSCSKCNGKIKGDCLNAIGKHFHPECFACGHCGKLFGNTPFFLEDGMPYCEADWNELFTTKCFACGFPVEAGDRWVEALNHNYHSQCFNCTYCKQNLEGQSFYNKGGRPFCKNHAR